jgi:RNase P subunit RPR2
VLKGRDALDLAPGVTRVRIHLDTRHVVVTCPHCGTDRIFRDGSVFLDRVLA